PQPLPATTPTISHIATVVLGDIVIFDNTHTAWAPISGERARIGLVIGVPGNQVTCAGPDEPILVDHAPPIGGVTGYAQHARPPTAFSYTVPAGRVWIQASLAFPDDDSTLHLADPTVPVAAVIPYLAR